MHSLPSILKTLPLLILAWFTLLATAGCSLVDTSWQNDELAPAPLVARSAGIVGASNPHIWFDRQAFSALNAIHAHGFNTVRIVWQTTGTGPRLAEIIARCKTLGLKPIPVLHDITGGTSDANGDNLDRMTQYWISIKSSLPPDVWINIANEWGPADSIVWRDAYIQAIQTLRASGITNTLVIDSGGWGQDHADILRYAVALLRVDSNLIFSIHMYGDWNDNAKIDRFFARCHDKGLPLLVGEFGYNFNGGSNNLNCSVNAAHLIDACNRHAIGYIAWSWCGNDSDNAWLNMTADWSNFWAPP